MPKVSSKKKSKKVVEDKPKKCCNICKKDLTQDKFYQSSSIMFDGFTPICKKCIKTMINYDDMSSIYSILQSIDIPFIYDLWQSCEDRKEEKESDGKKYDVLGNYIRQLASLPQHKGSGYKNSVFEKTTHEIEDENNNKKELSLEDKRRLKDTWGEDWSIEELILLDKTYRELSADKNMKFNSSKQYMKLATMNYVRSYMAMKNNNVSEAEKYTKLFNETMKMGEFNPSALAKNSNLEKLGSFSDFNLMVEECIDVIDLQRILPNYMQQPRDLPDKVIWYMINYMQDSLGYKRSSYEDIYNFYIAMEASYENITFEEAMKRYPRQSTLNDFLEDNVDENNNEDFSDNDKEE